MKYEPYFPKCGGRGHKRKCNERSGITYITDDGMSMGFLIRL
jgi:hypothetical protein